MTDIVTFFSTLGLLELIGVAGFIAYFLAFGAVQLGRMNGNGVGYSLLNVVAASLVATSLLAEFNLSSALIQGSWIIIGLIGLILRFGRSALVRAAHFETESRIGAQS